MKLINAKFDYTENSKKINKIWNFCIGCDHAYTLLREDVREQLRIAKKEIDFKYIRFHGIFMDDMHVVNKNYLGEIEYSFMNIDKIYDFLLSINVRPFVEISFMPEVLSSEKSYVFRYKGNITPPKDYDERDKFIKCFIEHLINRYGIEEISTWFFEVWNEPNLGGDIENLNTGFFMGTQEQYFELYEHTAKAIKSVSDILKVGGPASSNNQWINEFIEFNERRNNPLDFISTHHYPTDVIFGDKCQTGEEFKKLQSDLEKAKDKNKIWAKFNKFKSEIWKYVPKDTISKMINKARVEAKNYPLYYTEQSSLSGIDSDKEFGASYIAKINLDIMDKIDGYSYWCLSDIFEEGFNKPNEFHGGFGLFTNNGIVKAPYNAYKLLNIINGEILNNEFNEDSVNIRIIKDNNKDYILITNFDSLYYKVKGFEGNINISNYLKKIKNINMYLIDKTHSNAYYHYNKLKLDKYLSIDEINYLKKKGKLYKKKYKDYELIDNKFNLKFKIKGQAVILLEIFN